MFSVLCESRYWKDFVTSKFSEIEFNTLEECEEYIESSKKFHPNRFYYQIRKKINGVYKNYKDIDKIAVL